MPENAIMESTVINDPNREVKGKVVLITGADGGIGKALVAAFLKAGAARVIAATPQAQARGQASAQGAAPAHRPDRSEKHRGGREGRGRRRSIFWSTTPA